MKQDALDAQTLAHLGSWNGRSPGVERWSDESSIAFRIDLAHTSPTLPPHSWQALHPDDRERVNRPSPRPPARYLLQHRMPHHSSEWRTAPFTVVESYAEPKGSPISMTGTVRDITDYKRAGIGLAGQRDPNAVDFRERDRRHRRHRRPRTDRTANAALLKLLGYEAHEFIGKNISIIIPSPTASTTPNTSRII